MKTVLFLTGDYWHHSDTIEPLKKLMFPEDQWRVTFTEDPRELFRMDTEPDLIVSFKDPIENDQIPTPIWCDEAWTEKLFALAKENGTGILFAHAAVTDLEPDHPIVREMIRAVFTGHPQQCPVSLKPVKDHPILSGVSAFTFPDNDEHYMMSMLEDSETEIIAQTESVNGIQPGMWVSQCGRGRICCITPGHTTGNLTCEACLQVLKNAAAWCCR